MLAKVRQYSGTAKYPSVIYHRKSWRNKIKYVSLHQTNLQKDEKTTDIDDAGRHDGGVRSTRL